MKCTRILSFLDTVGKAIELKTIALSVTNENFKLEKGPTDKAKDPDPGGSDQENLGYKKLKNRKADRNT